MTPNSDVFVHETAICESENIGAGTKVWAFAHILPGAEIGSDCNISNYVFIEIGLPYRRSRGTQSRSAGL